MSTATFVEQCISGLVERQAIEQFVARWHEGEGGESLPAYLGFTDDEYALWVERPGFLAAILASKRLGFDLAAAVRDPATIPGGALTPQEAAEIREWLSSHRGA